MPRDKEQMIAHENKAKIEINEALRDKKKYCMLPGGLAAKVGAGAAAARYLHLLLAVSRASSTCP